MQRSITGEVYNLLGSVDEVILVRGVGEVQNDEDEAFGGDQDVVQRQMTFPATMANDLLPKLRAIPNVDYVAARLHRHRGGREPGQEAELAAVQRRRAGRGFSKDLADLTTTDGQRVQVSDLGTDEIYIDKAAADELELKVGEPVTVVHAGQGARLQGQGGTEGHAG